MTVKHGGSREGSGRPPLGDTRKVSITLPVEVWENIEDLRVKNGMNRSQMLRELIFFALGVQKS